ncbi:MAG TPA: response regulator [Phycisphaerae bacterium]|nr:response regulator [Phycisphaerales bacterium]HRX86400.1 response regulator [Phycisphaerae bacterium]
MTHKNASILVVDDDADLRRAVSMRLALAGYAVQQAESGEAALAVCAAHAPDVVVLDVNLPGISGFSVCAELRGAVDRPGLSVVFLTGAARNAVDQSVARRSDHAGGDYFLAKPHDSELLLQLVDEITSATALSSGSDS